MMLGVKLQSNQDIGIERHFLDFFDQVEQRLVLRVLPDDVAGFLHAVPPPPQVMSIHLNLKSERRF
jgi:hypothetical protein